ncbi:MAG: hypothetical protein ACI9VS_002504 [Candidatus Binatia bacterium]|jgi:hypothetical protein
MKNQIVVIVFALCALVLPDARAETSLKTSATFPARVVLWHVVPVTLNIQNNGDRNLLLLRQINAHRTTVRVQDVINGKTVYEGYVEVSRSNIHEQIERPPASLRPGGTLTHSFFLKSRWIDDRPAGAIFEHVGGYRIQFTIDVGYSSGGGKLLKAQTDWIELTVASPRRSEAKALATIVKMPNCAWLFEPQEMPTRNSMVVLRNWEVDLATFVRRNPTSYWTPHAHIALAHVYRNWAYENKANAGTKAKWMAKVKRSVELALGKKNPPSLGAAREALLSRDLNASQAKPRGPAAEPPPPNPWIAAYEELHAEYYDTRRLSVGRSPWVKEMKRKETEILEKGMLGKMPLEEAQRQAGEVTKEYIRKHGKPLSKSEWHRRYKIYAEQQKAQQARQRALQMKNAPENARILKEAIEKHRKEKAPK